MTYNLTFMENATVSSILTGINNAVPGWIPMILFFEFIVIALTGAYGNSRKTGNTNLIQWFALSSLVTTFSAFFLGGLFVTPEDYALYLPVIIGCVGINILCVLILMLSKDD